MTDRIRGSTDVHLGCAWTERRRRHGDVASGLNKTERRVPRQIARHAQRRRSVEERPARDRQGDDEIFHRSITGGHPNQAVTVGRQIDADRKRSGQPLRLGFESDCPVLDVLTTRCLAQHLQRWHEGRVRVVGAVRAGGILGVEVHHRPYRRRCEIVGRIAVPPGEIRPTSAGRVHRKRLVGRYRGAIDRRVNAAVEGARTLAISTGFVHEQPLPGPDQPR